MNFNFKKLNKGSSMLELIFYVAIFSLTAVLVINAILVMVSSFKENNVNNYLSHNIKLIETISREIKNSDAVTGLSSDNIKLSGTDSLGNPRTSQFLWDGNSVIFYENDVEIGALDSSNVDVLNLAFYQVNSIVDDSAGEVNPLNSTAISFEITLQSNYLGHSSVETFYNTLVLRGSY